MNNEMLIEQNITALRAVLQLPKTLEEDFYLIDDIRPEIVARVNYRAGYAYAMCLVMETIEDVIR